MKSGPPLEYEDASSGNSKNDTSTVATDKSKKDLETNEKMPKGEEIRAEIPVDLLLSKNDSRNTESRNKDDSNSTLDEKASSNGASSLKKVPETPVSKVTPQQHEFFPAAVTAAKLRQQRKLKALSSVVNSITLNSSSPQNGQSGEDTIHKKSTKTYTHVIDNKDTKEPLSPLAKTHKLMKQISRENESLKQEIQDLKDELKQPLLENHSSNICTNSDVDEDTSLVNSVTESKEETKKGALADVMSLTRQFEQTNRPSMITQQQNGHLQQLQSTKAPHPATSHSKKRKILNDPSTEVNSNPKQSFASSEDSAKELNSQLQTNAVALYKSQSRYNKLQEEFDEAKKEFQNKLVASENRANELDLQLQARKADLEMSQSCYEKLEKGMLLSKKNEQELTRREEQPLSKQQANTDELQRKENELNKVRDELTMTRQQLEGQQLRFDQELTGEKERLASDLRANADILRQKESELSAVRDEVAMTRARLQHEQLKFEQELTRGQGQREIADQLRKKDAELEKVRNELVATRKLAEDQQVKFEQERNSKKELLMMDQQATADKFKEMNSQLETNTVALHESQSRYKKLKEKFDEAKKEFKKEFVASEKRATELSLQLQASNAELLKSQARCEKLEKIMLLSMKIEQELMGKKEGLTPEQQASAEQLQRERTKLGVIQDELGTTRKGGKDQQLFEREFSRSDERLTPVQQTTADQLKRKEDELNKVRDELTENQKQLEYQQMKFDQELTGEKKRLESEHQITADQLRRKESELNTVKNELAMTRELLQDQQMKINLGRTRTTEEQLAPDQQMKINLGRTLTTEEQLSPDDEADRVERKMFKSNRELCLAVDAYLGDDDALILGAKTFYGNPIGSWDVSMVSDFSKVFNAQRNPRTATFNEGLGQWDVSRATNMSQMFSGAAKFNQDISNWDVSSVTNVYFMFHGAYAFRQDLSRWKTTKVTNLESMCYKPPWPSLEEIFLSWYVACQSFISMDENSPMTDVSCSNGTEKTIPKWEITSLQCVPYESMTTSMSCGTAYEDRDDKPVSSNLLSCGTITNVEEPVTSKYACGKTTASNPHVPAQPTETSREIVPYDGSGTAAKDEKPTITDLVCRAADTKRVAVPESGKMGADGAIAYAYV